MVALHTTVLEDWSGEANPYPIVKSRNLQTHERNLAMQTTLPE